mmetsp:Transcript_17336/g.27081  ORF Transcript_17336/g.27081 Transcript_17336/m.27081 type:complete len:447 (-) Transcript_17336:176-1516(-)|eukprot:CAMPEP_0201531086 /NCGR_PEP_ID=MMETSP0161_2-20130828/46573_1 /ASSEMBLY_ACC=CAM_ASM_000251 /TAXON_ID=180227 /ORGANISM="Neoparamoeba aestuarina, Strain SoJaBio B1-5/56/2" /LENGTH=446 /DNA_ID=CAMNT_0047933767 /DNA_START=129 /DNA_END=1469 /DNA_ORIENTATION=-
MPSSSPLLLLSLSLFLVLLSLPSIRSQARTEPLTEPEPNVDQAEYFGFRMGEGPFCDSECMPNGKWEYRRDWVLGDLDNFGRQSTFIWAVDGPPSYWSERCGTRVNDMIFGNRDPNTFILQTCIPEIIYMFEFTFEFQNDEGLLIEKLKLNGAFTPSQEAWDEFVTLVGERISPNFIDSEIYTPPWTLFRLMPSLEGANYTDKYNGDIFYQQTFITTYERNCCTFSGSVNPIEKMEYCDYDEDLDTDESEFVSFLFCEYFFDNAVVDDYYVACGGGTDGDVCDRVYVGVNGGENKREKVRKDEKRSEALLPREPRSRVWEVLGKFQTEREVKRRSVQEDIVHPAARRSVAGELIATIRSGAKVEIKRMHGAPDRIDPILAGPEVRDMMTDYRSALEKAKRGTYDYTFQPIEAIGQDQGPFYYVPYTSSIAAPYCAFKREGCETDCD